MRLRYRQVTRGQGKIFQRLTVEGKGSALGSLEVRSTTSEGNVVPSSIHRLGEEEFVIVVPVLDLPQCVELFSVSADGGRSLLDSHNVSPGWAKNRSRINTALKNEEAESIRNIDSKNRLNKSEITIDRVCFNAWDNNDIVHISVVSLAPPRHDWGEVPGFVLLDSNGREVQDGIVEPIVLSDRIEERGYYSRRHVTYSVRIARDLWSFVVWVRPWDGEDSFVTIQDFELQAWRDRWHFDTLSADFDEAYPEWFRSHKASRSLLEIQRRTRLAIQPRFSIVVPVFNTPIPFLDDMVGSVLGQSYEDFELLLVNASPDNRELADRIARYVNADRRVRELTLDENLGITLNTNQGILAASGDFVCFLDHDDVIEPDLLFSYAEAVNQRPDTDLLYCDEDKLQEGTLVSPFFKPDWNPDLLCSCNYVTHLLAVRKSVLDELELPGREFDGAQDHNMTFRISELARHVHHVRKVLYHWRIHPGSTAGSPDAKSFTSNAGQLSVQGHLDRCHIPAKAVIRPKFDNIFQLDFELEEEPLVSIVIPSRDESGMLGRCVDSLYRSSYKNFEVVIVENGSREPETFALYDSLVREHERVSVVTYPLQGDEFNFSKLVNFGARRSKGDLILLLNNDTEVVSLGWLTQMVGRCLRDDVGAVGAKLLYPDGTIQHAGVSFHLTFPDHLGQLMPDMSPNYFNLLNFTQDVTAVTGACLLTRRELFDRLGGFDETDFTVAYNDVDYCLRLGELGYHVVYCAESVLTHYESVSRGSDLGGEKAVRHCAERANLLRRWPSYFVEGDPMLSPYIAKDGKYRKLNFLI
ncbi:glycosyltransferase family 2 protein [uncultured Olsenella sp.]|uniref:glycosyltransferase family 2 protein n=1 Tax=uncultured Olsenella sp. TaxID=190764 RepID=UPI0026DA87FC|nr:glycosyltransferase family 2 protein [uncultured Olsenella sp.]